VHYLGSLQQKGIRNKRIILLASYSYVGSLKPSLIFVSKVGSHNVEGPALTGKY